MLYTLNRDNYICKLFLNKVKKKTQETKNTDSRVKGESRHFQASGQEQVGEKWSHSNPSACL